MIHFWYLLIFDWISFYNNVDTHFNVIQYSIFNESFTHDFYIKLITQSPRFFFDFNNDLYSNFHQWAIVITCVKYNVISNNWKKENFKNEYDKLQRELKFVYINSFSFLIRTYAIISYDSSCRNSRKSIWIVRNVAWNIFIQSRLIEKKRNKISKQFHYQCDDETIISIVQLYQNTLKKNRILYFAINIEEFIINLQFINSWQDDMKEFRSNVDVWFNFRLSFNNKNFSFD